MAATVVPLATVKLHEGPASLTAENRYWRSFKNQRQFTNTAEWPVSDIAFPTGAPNDVFAVTAGPRIELYSIRSRKLLKLIGRFDSEAHSGNIRHDGRVLVAGEDTGRVQVFDILNGRATILKTWHVHKQPVWTTRWSPYELTTLMTCSDDKSVRLWDLPSNEPSRVFHGHCDYVRSGHFIGRNLVVSASYDQTVRVWDARAPNRASMIFQHASPVEKVLPLGQTTLLAAAGNSISVLDLVGARARKTISNHQKTASNGTRLVSGSLDGNVKVYESGSWKVVHSIKYPSPVRSVSVVATNNEDRHLAVGMQSGVLAVRTRLTGAARERATEANAYDHGIEALIKLDDGKAKRKRRESSRKKMAMLGNTVDAVIDVCASGKRLKQAWQRDLRSGRVRQALDAVIDMTDPRYDPVTALTVFTHLRHRSALHDALADRDQLSVMPILKWVHRYMIDPRYRSVCVDVALHMLSVYAEYTADAPELAQTFKQILGRVSHEVETAQLAVLTGGMVESLLIGSME